MKENNKNKKGNKSNGNKNFIIIFMVLVLAGCSIYALNSSKTKPAEEAPQAQNKPNTQNIAPVVSKGDLKIDMKEVTENAKFYPYQAGDIYMEAMAVKAADGTVRTALNTCQVCFDSGQGYYKQEGNTVVCQNCGNVFGVDDIEKVKGGCNPVPILSEDKTVDGDNIVISEQFLSDNKDYFADWKRN